MTLLIVGLLLGLAGIVWMMVIDIISADRQCPKSGSCGSDKPVTGPIGRESRAA